MLTPRLGSLEPSRIRAAYAATLAAASVAISWKDPGPEDRDLGLEGCRLLGIHSAPEVVGRIAPERRVHGVGHGGRGARLNHAARRPDRLHRGPGEITLFIDGSQVTFLEDLMGDIGCLDSREMAGAFQLRAPTI